MKAIETKYKGYRFRSRLEARWAVFFDALGLKWEYEPEGFDLGFGELYLPDFWIPIQDHIMGFSGCGHWVEIKAKAPTPSETRRMQQLVLQSGHCGKILSGDPLDYTETRCNRAYPKAPEGWVTVRRHQNGEGSSGMWAWPSYYVRADIPQHARDVFPDSDSALSIFLQAATAARSARFEHGECGAHA